MIPERMIPLSIGCLFSDRIEALLDGRVTIAGASATVRCVEAQTLFRSVLRAQSYDIAELSLGSHIAAVAAGRRAYLGLPVFLSRSFRHGNLYIRTDRGIDRPEDLAGKRIGLADYQQTAALWLRGILADDHGVARDSIDWVAAGLHAPVLTDRVPGPPPPGVRLTRASGTLDAMLAEGALDAVISPTTPRCVRTGDAPVAPLWRDARATEQAWFARTGVFPIMHVAVLRRSLAEAHPGLPAAVIAAFEAAHARALEDLAWRNFPKLAMPWLSAAAAAGATGPAWSHGVTANRATLEQMLRYAVADGIASPELTVDALFA